LLDEDKHGLSWLKEVLIQMRRAAMDLHSRSRLKTVACDQSFDSEKALQQHLRDSPAHAPSFECETCDRSFGSEEALEQHLRDSPVHAPSFDCETCDRSFGSEEALEQHLRDSLGHQQVPETPLDVFFRSFPTFDYDPSLPPATSYAYLREHKG
jgi:Zinc-finger double-stranded RNA-binding/Zinc-finger of C2H2 type